MLAVAEGRAVSSSLRVVQALSEDEETVTQI